MKSIDIARICFEANRAYCSIIGDDSHSKWEEAPAWQKDSTVVGVEYRIKNPDITPEDSHNSWLEVKNREGWKYGPIKNPDTKEHPCYLPYNELPEDQRIKDHLFLAIVQTFTK